MQGKKHHLSKLRAVAALAPPSPAQIASSISCMEVRCSACAKRNQIQNAAVQQICVATIEAGHAWAAPAVGKAGAGGAEVCCPAETATSIAAIKAASSSAERPPVVELDSMDAACVRLRAGGAAAACSGSQRPLSTPPPQQKHQMWQQLCRSTTPAGGRPKSWAPALWHRPWALPP